MVRMTAEEETAELNRRQKEDQKKIQEQRERSDREQQLLPQVQIDNLARWCASGEPYKWVMRHKGSWDHQDWVSLLEALRHTVFWPMNTNDIGNVLEQTKVRFNSQAYYHPKTTADHWIAEEWGITIKVTDCKQIGKTDLFVVRMDFGPPNAPWLCKIEGTYNGDIAGALKQAIEHARTVVHSTFPDWNPRGRNLGKKNRF